MWTSINKRLYLFISAILVIGIIAGIIFVIMLDEATKEIIFLNINEFIQNFKGTNINNIVSHLVILSSLIILSLFAIGLPLVIFFIFFNGFSLGFIISTLTIIFGIKGLLYSIIYILISKGLYLLFGSILVVALIRITKIVIEKFITKKDNKDSINRLMKKSLLCLGIILFSDILLYFFGTNLINIFNFLII